MTEKLVKKINDEYRKAPEKSILEKIKMRVYCFFHPEYEIAKDIIDITEIMMY